MLPPGISSTLSPMLPLAVKLHISGCAGAQSAVVWRFRLAHPAREGLTAMPSGGWPRIGRFGTPKVKPTWQPNELPRSDSRPRRTSGEARQAG